ncbi:hypothetical protein Hanom_Chr01g00080771 [Helianthus anomalus]
MLAEKHKIEKDQNNDMRNQVAPLLQQVQDQKLQIQQHDSTIETLQVMEQLVDRLDVAMFNAILREFAEEMPTDPLSDPIGDLRVLPIPAGKSSFGAGAQLKKYHEC